MVTLEADRAPPWPPHPTMPPYTLRKTSPHPSELNSQVERPSKPQVWDITPCGTKSHAEPSLCLSTTMAIRTMTAKHDTTLPTPFLPPTASASTPWQQNHIKISTGMVRPGASQQHDMQYGKRTLHDKLQSPDMMPYAQSKNQGHTGPHDELQCQVSGGKMMTFHTITQKVTSTPNITHADTTTPFYTKTSEKVTLHLPHQQSNHYSTTDINQTATETMDSTNIAHHRHTRPCTQIDATRPTHPPTIITNTMTSHATSHPRHTSDTVPHIDSQLRPPTTE